MTKVVSIRGLVSSVALSLITTLSVAWSLQSWEGGDPSFRCWGISSDHQLQHLKGLGWERLLLVGAEPTAREMELFRDRALSGFPREEELKGGRLWLKTHSAGLPMRCVKYTFKDWSPGEPAGFFGAMYLGRHRIGFGIDPIGMAFNVIFYAVFFYGLTFLLPYSWRRFRDWCRSRSGNCATCSYSLLGLPPNTPCPECGTTPKPRKSKQPKKPARSPGPD